MNDKQIIRMAMGARGKTQKQLAKNIGKNHQSSISNFLNDETGHMRMDTFINLLDAMEYSVVVIDRRTGEKFCDVGLKRV
ncbi:MAG: helix-turn-helix transcriptional regulator [Sphaerochaetaceae bacterium]|nr:helix-turn-helix transcriptional regulator [Sphaerochaetaceae bacterium]